ncbi:MAG: DUF4097 family beta strand repeat protein [Clostridiaceae bacterium]|nr:DUF4097 family beta strand repeat protein [Clostridiaceae bacterium]
MKRRLARIMLIVLAFTVLCCLSGCASFDSVTYANADQYTAGDAEITEKVENIEIDWLTGNVSVVPHSENTVLVSEKAEAGMPEELRVHWWLEGTTLRVKFAASGTGFRQFHAWHKDLIVTVPETLSLDDVVIQAASAEIEARDLAAETLSVSTASGDMDIYCTANTIRLKSASGNLQLTQQEQAREISMDTASGIINANLAHVDEAYFESSSGKINVTAASVDSFSAKTASGNITCALAPVPSVCKLHTVSGKVTLSLPADADFAASIRTTSGDVESDFALQKDGRTYICGSGSADIDIETTSGSIAIWKN